VELRSPPWSLLPVFAGVMLLDAKQESLLALIFLALETGFDLGHRRGPVNAKVVAIFLRRVLVLLVCIWAAHVRSRLEHQRRKLESNEAALAQKLAQSLKASALAHELRQPLSHLLLQTRLLRHRCEEGAISEPALQHAMADQQSCGRQINGLIEAIGSLLNQHVAPTQRVALTAVLRTGLQRLKPLLDDLRVELELQLPQAPVLVNGQAKQLEIACCNLLSNACEALALQPQPRRLLCQLTAEDACIELIVADNGAGLPSTHLRDLLMGSSKPQGRGVGLLMVHSIACLHGGVLQLGGSQSLGSAELRLRLPLVKPDAN
jgi:signal transduction histidine kinase